MKPGFGRIRQFLVVMVALAACGPLPPPAPMPDGDPAACAAACARMRELRCPEAESTPDGATCETWCENVERSGTVSINPRCLAEISTCDDIDTCIR